MPKIEIPEPFERAGGWFIETPKDGLSGPWPTKKKAKEFYIKYLLEIDE